ncbi:MAG: hypothetical protein ABIT01_10455 [Thermoanaerobaculia bacterium]
MSPAPGGVVEDVTIRVGNVFSMEEATRHGKFPYGLANALHITTRPTFIQQALLFRVGDAIDPAILNETERNLRAFRLFRAVRVSEREGHVLVEADDAWTLIPRGTFGQKGGAVTYSFGVEERNLLGTGRVLSFRYDRGPERLTRSFTFIDPHVFLPYTTFQLTAEDLSDGRTLQIGLTRPFYSLHAPNSAGALYRNALFDVTLYRGGEVETIWKKRERRALGEAGLRVFEDSEAAWRVVASAEWSDIQLAPEQLGIAPPEAPRRFLFLGLALEREGRRWLKLRNVNRIDRDEDFALAPTGRIQLEGSPGVLGASAAIRARGEMTVGTSLPWGFALASGAAETRIQDGPRQTRFVADLRAYALLRRFTIAGHVGAAMGWRLDPEERVELDGLAGLRAYRLHAASGSRRLVGNLEARTRLVSDILHLVSLGAAAFVDDGFSWGAPDGFVHLMDVGAGLRIGLTRASSNDLIRIDVARGLRRDPLGRAGWLVSFSSGQAF